jgi:hypothetical protein
MVKSSLAKCQQINEASLAYANALNANLSVYMKNLLVSFPANKRKGLVMAPYTYFYYKGFDVDIKNQMTPHEYDGGEDIELYSGSEEAEARIALNYKSVLDVYAPRWKKAKIVVGLIGITMAAADDNDDPSAHYASYVFRRGAGSRQSTLTYFDSAGWTGDEIYWHAIRGAFPVKDANAIGNVGIFETGGGVSTNEYSYIGQNIFCHSWALWFWYQTIDNGLSIDEINELAGKGSLKNQNNLIRIKKFIYNILIPKIDLKFLTVSDKELFINCFMGIYLNKKELTRTIDV